MSGEGETKENYDALDMQVGRRASFLVRDFSGNGCEEKTPRSLACVWPKI